MLERDFALTGHHGGVREHVAVMRGINRQQSCGRADDFAKGLVGRDRFHIGIDRLLPAAAANIDMRRHVDVVGQARLEIAQTISRRIRAFGMLRRFDGVDVKVVREWMVHVQFQNRVQGRENFLSARIRLAAERPLVPRPQVHHRFGEKRAHIGIVRELFPDFAHRGGVGFIERLAILGLRICVTMAQRFDHRLLDR